MAKNNPYNHDDNDNEMVNAKKILEMLWGEQCAHQEVRRANGQEHQRRADATDKHLYFFRYFSILKYSQYTFVVVQAYLTPLHSHILCSDNL